MLNYIAASPIHLPKNAVFKIDSGFFVGDDYFNPGKELVYGGNVPRYFLPEFRTGGKKKLTFVYQHGNMNDEKQQKHIHLWVTENLFQRSDTTTRGVESSEFNTFKADWAATIVPVAQGGTGQNNGRDVINKTLRPQQRLWARKTFDADGFRADERGILPLSFDKSFYQLSSVGFDILLRMSGYFGDELGWRDDAGRNTTSHTEEEAEDIDPEDYPFVLSVWNLRIYRYYSGDRQAIPNGFPTDITIQKAIPGWIFTHNISPTLDITNPETYYFHTHSFREFRGLSGIIPVPTYWRAHGTWNYQVTGLHSLKGLSICSRI